LCGSVTLGLSGPRSARSESFLRQARRDGRAALSLARRAPNRRRGWDISALHSGALRTAAPYHHAGLNAGRTAGGWCLAFFAHRHFGSGRNTVVLPIAVLAVPEIPLFWPLPFLAVPKIPLFCPSPFWQVP